MSGVTAFTKGKSNAMAIAEMRIWLNSESVYLP
jgi:hypothetical protein